MKHKTRSEIKSLARLMVVGSMVWSLWPVPMTQAALRDSNDGGESRGVSAGQANRAQEAAQSAINQLNANLGHLGNTRTSVSDRSQNMISGTDLFVKSTAITANGLLGELMVLSDTKQVFPNGNSFSVLEGVVRGADGKTSSFQGTVQSNITRNFAYSIAFQDGRVVKGNLSLMTQTIEQIEKGTYKNTSEIISPDGTVVNNTIVSSMAESHLTPIPNSLPVVETLNSVSDQGDRVEGTVTTKYDGSFVREIRTTKVDGTKIETVVRGSALVEGKRVAQTEEKILFSNGDVLMNSTTEEINSFGAPTGKPKILTFNKTAADGTRVTGTTTTAADGSSLRIATTIAPDGTRVVSRTEASPLDSRGLRTLITNDVMHRTNGTVVNSWTQQIVDSRYNQLGPKVSVFNKTFPDGSTSTGSIITQSDGSSVREEVVHSKNGATTVIKTDVNSNGVITHYVETVNGRTVLEVLNDKKKFETTLGRVPAGESSASTTTTVWGPTYDAQGRLVGYRKSSTSSAR